MAMSRIIVVILVINTAVVVASGLLNYKLLSAFVAQQQTADAVSPSHPRMKTGGEEYVFFPVEKIIVSLQDSGREYYFVIDLVLQAPAKTDLHKLKQIDPMVRNSAVAHLSTLDFTTLRAMPITELQSSLEQVVFADFASKSLATPFAHVLVSKLIVQ